MDLNLTATLQLLYCTNGPHTRYQNEKPIYSKLTCIFHQNSPKISFFTTPIRTVNSSYIHSARAGGPGRRVAVFSGVFGVDAAIDR